MRWPVGLVLCGLVVGLLASGCAGPDGEGPEAGLSSVEPAAKVTVTADVAFAAAAPDLAAWSDPVLDVFAPSGASEAPLVVILPPHSLTKDNPASVQLATALAERGAVAVVANWTQLAEPAGALRDDAVVTAVAEAGLSVAGCAVAFASDHASDFGADPSRLVLVGELFGANTASMIAFGDPGPYPGCAVTGVSWRPDRLVGVNGDWMMGSPEFDAVGAAAVEVLSVWSLLDQAPDVPTTLVTTTETVSATPRCGDPSGWLDPRDAGGAMRARLEAVGALADGCVDIGDMADATAAEMTARGYDADVLPLTNSDDATQTIYGAAIGELGPADLDTLLTAVLPRPQ